MLTEIAASATTLACVAKTLILCLSLEELRLRQVTKKKRKDPRGKECEAHTAKDTEIQEVEVFR